MIEGPLLPGDVVCVRTPDLFGRLIRDFQHIAGLPDFGNHVLVVHHVTDDVLWGIEGRPGGVGWVQVSQYFRNGMDKYAYANNAQPKAAWQRQRIADAMLAAIGTKYDWKGIAEDAARDLRLPELWRSDDWTPGVSPGHVVCSSVAAWAYAHCALAYPHDAPMRNIEPGDWLKWIMRKGWPA